MWFCTKGPCHIPAIAVPHINQEMQTALHCEMTSATRALRRAATGIAGLDDVLAGGLARNRLHLLEGSPGAGKTTIALQFLMQGAAGGEDGIYVSLAGTERAVR